MEENNVENEEVKEIEEGNNGIKIANDVISVIAGVAVSEVPGVASMAGGFAGGITEVLSGKKNLSKGIKVDADEKEVRIDVNIIVEYGSRIPDVAYEIQTRVKKSVENMTGLKVSEVNVHVQGVKTEKEVEEKDGVEVYEGESLIDENGKEKGEGENWINVGYKHSGPYAKVLSNLFPYEFVFKGKKLNSIESFFQGIKFKDPQLQDIVFTYGGLDSNYIQACSEYNWKENGIVFWQGKEIDRYSEKYDDLIDELYISAIQNPLYRNVLKNCTKEIIHTMGKKEKSETTFTRYEFEKQLNCLKEFLKKESN